MARKSDREIAVEVIDGKWGNGNERIVNLTNAGYSASKIQAIVNEIARAMIEFDVPTKQEESKRVLEVNVDLSKYGALVLNFTGV